MKPPKPKPAPSNSKEPMPPQARKKRRIGFMEGQMSIPDDFDTMLAKEIEEMFYGEE
jgi:hypothetical protein